VKKVAADALTAEEHKEKVKPAHDAFQAPPADIINESLKAEFDRMWTWGSMGLVCGPKYWEGEIDGAHHGSADNGEPTLLTAARKSCVGSGARRW
jgi:hypothetical protein